MKIYILLSLIAINLSLTGQTSKVRIKGLDSLKINHVTFLDTGKFFFKKSYSPIWILDTTKCKHYYEFIFETSIGTDIIGTDINGKISFVKGDSLNAMETLIKVIRSQNKIIHTKDSIISEYKKVIEAGRMFSNNLPQFYRTKEGNCKWPAYTKALDRNGWKIQRLNKPQQYCSESK